MSDGTRLRRYTATLAVCAVALLGLSLLTWQHGPITVGNLVRFTSVVAIVVLAQVGGVRLRVGRSRLRLGWGEAAVILALYLLPSAWVPLAVGVGAFVALIVDRRTGATERVGYVVRNTAMLTIAAGAAALTACAINDPWRATVTNRAVIALVAAALVYYLVGGALVARTVHLVSGVPYLRGLRRALRAKLHMVVGNVTIGLGGVAVLGLHLIWLIVLAPMLWLLRTTYRNQLAAVDERDDWQAFTDAQRELSQPEQSDVVSAGIAGALRVFAADMVEVQINDIDGTAWVYQGFATDEAGVPPRRQRPVDGPPAAGTVEHPLTVGGATVGTLRITRAAPLTPREQWKVTVFGGALAVALHDAAAQRELRALGARRAHEAGHDPLTGVANRSGFLGEGGAALRQLDPEAPVALLVLDINHFKAVNETLGHIAGDDLLRVVADRTRSLAGSGELVARLGGDEFGVLLTGLPSGPASQDGPGSGAHGYALRWARDLVDLLTNPVEISGVPVSPEASVGVVVAAAGECDLSELLRRADIAMRQAKLGGSAVSWYDESVDTASTDRLAMQAELREALDDTDQLITVLQPIVDLRSGRAIGFEALTRWQHPRRGELGPATFISVLEQSDLVGRFTWLILDRALHVAADWSAQGIDLPVSVNLSARCLLDVNLPNEVGRLLVRHGLRAERLVLEITETVVVPELAIVLDVLEALRSLGVHLSVDDFGTGYSSLTFITRVLVNELKIDRSFVSRIADSPQAAAIIRATLRLGEELRLRVVAEGVESAEQRASLIAFGCVAAQGNHFCPPLPAAEAYAAVLGMLGGGGTVIEFPNEEVS